VPQKASVPAAALTAYAREDQRQAALAAGFQLHIAKPVEPSQLVWSIAKLVGAGKGPLAASA
jgi:CheY-like chemotaxis protein